MQYIKVGRNIEYIIRKSFEEFYNFTSPVHVDRGIVAVDVGLVLMIGISFKPEFKIGLDASSFTVDVLASPVYRFRLTRHGHSHVILYVQIIVEH